MIIPKAGSRFKLAFVIEFKFASSSSNLKALARSALDQINARNYASKIGQHSQVEGIIKLGLAFGGKDVEAVYVSKALYHNFGSKQLCS